MQEEGRPNNKNNKNNYVKPEKIIIREARRLPQLWKMVIYSSLLFLVFGDLIYSLGIFELKRGDCLPDPSEFDEFWTKLTSFSGLVLATTLTTAIQYWERD